MMVAVGWFWLWKEVGRTHNIFFVGRHDDETKNGLVKKYNNFHIIISTAAIQLLAFVSIAKNQKEKIVKDGTNMCVSTPQKVTHGNVINGFTNDRLAGTQPNPQPTNTATFLCWYPILY